ncbi:MAG: amidohydrolase family protein [Candidatus Aenigmarchaeota archaeon]|nr:amidohydrolase family protein [Candidatus Aenigmarchaeota archaeon]
MKTIIKNAKIVSEKVYKNGFVAIENGIIVSLGTMEDYESFRDNWNHTIDIVDATGKLVAPGSIGIHDHGANGFDTMDGTVEALCGMGNYLASSGTTLVYPTTVSASIEETEKICNAISQISLGNVIDKLGFEGTWIAKLKEKGKAMGGHISEHIRPPKKDEFIRYWDASHGRIKMATLDPDYMEDDNFSEFMETLRYHGVRPMMGHTDCSHSTAVKFLTSGGIIGVRHVPNCLSGRDGDRFGKYGAIQGIYTAREQGYPVFAEVVIDGVHCNSDTVKKVIEKVGIDHVIAATDGMKARRKELEPGYEMEIDNNRVRYEKNDDGFYGLYKFKEGELVWTPYGSALHLNEAAKNLRKMDAVQEGDRGLLEIFQLLSTNPARFLGLEDRKGRIKVGFDADIVIYNDDFDVDNVYVNGVLV